MPTTTSNYSFNKPNVNSADDEDLWGGQLNDNWDSIDALLKTASDMVTSSVSSASVTLTTSDKNKLVLADTSANDITVNLPAAATATDGFMVAIKKVSASNTLTIDGNGSETIDGATTLAFTEDDNAVALVCDGSNWHVLAKNVKIYDQDDMAADSADALTTQQAAKAYIDAEVAGIGFPSPDFTSGEQTINNASALTVPHGLGSNPKLVQIILRCKTANLNYSPGDEIVATGLTQMSNSRGVNVLKDATNVTILTGDGGVTIFNKSSLGADALTNGSWRYVVEAWA